MQGKHLRTWIAAVVLVAIVLAAGTLELARSRSAAIETTYTKANLTGYLVSEWIADSFAGVEYLLRDSIAGLTASTVDATTRTVAENNRMNELLMRRSRQFGNVVFLGIFDSDCVIQNGSITDIIGDSSMDLERAYCGEVMREPLEQLKLSDFFVSSTGAMNVSATYPILADDRTIAGFALAGLDLAFFQRWLDRIEDPTVTITIMDSNQTLIARTPLSGGVGERVDDPMLTEFTSHDSETMIERVPSPLDGVDRFWSLRKIRELPFVVAVGYEAEDVLAPWRTEVAVFVLAALLFVTLALLLARAYNRNTETADHMHTLAMTDQLTGLMNRRSFIDLAKARLADVRRRGGVASAVMIDIDHFKAINDTLGHEAGDKVLALVSKIVRSSFRSSDLVCRWGGEEFAVLLMDADQASATALAKRLNSSMALADFGDDTAVTVSQGIASYGGGVDLEEMLRRADEMLYAAKQAGRNCVRSAGS